MEIIPPAGSLSVTGAVARVITIGLVLMGGQPIIDAGIIGSAGSVSIQGYTPTVQQSIDHARLTLTGYAPSLGGVDETIVPSTGTLTLGIVPDNSIAITIPAGSLSITGFVPDVTNPSAPKPLAGIAVLTGYEPIVSTNPTPPQGTITAQGYAPIVGHVIIPDTARLEVTPEAMVSWTANTEPDLAGYVVHHGVTSRVYTSSVDVGMATFYVWSDLPDGINYFAVRAYDTSGNFSIYSDEVSISIAGRAYPPTVTINTVTGTQIDTDVGSLTLSGNVPIVDLGIVPPSESLTLAGHQNAIIADPETLTLTGLEPTCVQSGTISYNITPPPAVLTLTGYTKLQIAEPTWSALVLQGYTPSVTVEVLGSVSITIPAGSLTLFAPTPFNPNLAQHANTIIAPGGTPDHA